MLKICQCGTEFELNDQERKRRKNSGAQNSEMDLCYRCFQNVKIYHVTDVVIIEQEMTGFNPPTFNMCKIPAGSPMCVYGRRTDGKYFLTVGGAIVIADPTIFHIANPKALDYAPKLQWMTGGEMILESIRKDLESYTGELI